MCLCKYPVLRSWVTQLTDATLHPRSFNFGAQQHRCSFPGRLSNATSHPYFVIRKPLGADESNAIFYRAGYSSPSSAHDVSRVRSLDVPPGWPPHRFGSQAVHVLDGVDYYVISEANGVQPEDVKKLPRRKDAPFLLVPTGAGRVSSAD